MLNRKSNYSNGHTSDDEEITRTFVLLEKGKKEIQLTERKDVVLIWGGTGAGKSTFVQWIAGDNANLIATETINGTGEYIIADTGDRIGKVTTKSKTIFPELVVDVNTNTTYYDCPGFGDTRSTSYDIASAYFLRTVIDHVEKVKILFLIGHHSVKIGLDRQSFPELVRNVVDLIKDVDKYSDSIALAVTKVDNAYVNRGRTLVSDAVTIKGIAHFLDEYKQTLENDRIHSHSDVKRKFLKEAVKFVDVLLTVKDHKYPRIVIFRRPDETGPLSEIDLMQSGKKMVQEMFQNELQFTEVHVNDFGYTISNKSKLDIISLIGAINKKISVHVESITKDIQTQFKDLVYEFSEKLKSTVYDSQAPARISDAQEFRSKLMEGHKVLSQAVTSIIALQNVNDFPKGIEAVIANLQCNVSQSNIEGIKDQKSYFDFLEKVSIEKLMFESSTWATSFQESVALLSDYKHKVQMHANDLAVKMNEKLSSDINQIADKVREHFQVIHGNMRDKIKSFTDSSRSVSVNLLDAEEFNAKLVDGHNFLSQLTKETKSLVKIHFLFSKIAHALKNLRITTALRTMTSLKQKVKSFEFLQAASSSKLSFGKTLWSTLFNGTVAFASVNMIAGDVERVEESVNLRIDSEAFDIARELRTVLESKLSNMAILQTEIKIKDWQQTFAKLTDSSHTITTIFSEIEAACIEHDVQNFKIDDSTQSIRNQEEFLAFLQIIRGGKASGRTQDSRWRSNFVDVLSYLDSAAKWYTFLNEAFRKLSDYSVQQYISKIDAQSFGFFEKDGSLKKDLVTSETFEQFLIAMRQFEMKSLGDVDSFAPSVWQLEELNEILENTIGDRIIVKCFYPQNKVVIKGNFVKFSSFLSNDIFRSCVNYMAVKTVQIMATNTVFFDMDFVETGKTFRLIVIAPIWNVVGTNRKISLDGINAEEHKQKTPPPGDYPGERGTDGFAGLPGGAAGSFFGIGKVFVNSAGLEISANGGRGGFGQNGGTGRDGIAGIDAPNVDAQCDVAPGFKSEILDFFTVVSTSSFAQNVYNIKVRGKEGGPGGDGGKCGVGGMGGFAGKITIINFGEHLNIKTSEIRGQDGRDGNTGMHGHGGKHGNDIVSKCGSYHYFNPHGTKRFFKEGKTEVNSGCARHGLMNFECNRIGQQMPDPAPLIHQKDMIVNEFKSFALESWNNRFRKDFSGAFYSMLLVNDEVKALSSTLGLIDELMRLEKQVHTLSRSDMRYLYWSHMQNIEEFTLKALNNETSSDNMKVLSFLCTATFSKAQSFEKKSSNDLIVDITGYLDLAMNEIEQFKILEADDNMVGLLQKHKIDFKSRIDKKISEANSLIAGKVSPEIDVIELAIKEQTASFLKETVELQNIAKSSVMDAIDMKRKIVNAIAGGMLFGLVRTLSQGLVFLGPMGAAAGTLIGGGASVLQALTLGGKRTVPTMPKNLQDKIAKFGVVSIELINQIKDDNERLHEAGKMVEETRAKVKQFEVFEKNIHSEFIPMITNMGQELQTARKNFDSQSQVALDVSKWQVQAKLRDIRVKIKQFTRGFEAEDQLVRLVEKLEEVMTTMIDVYDRIESYHEQQKLANYMADLNSAAAKRIIVTDEALSSAVRKLEIVTRTNVILGQYFSVLSAFKQWVFPFADVYLQDFKTLSNFKESKPDPQLLVQTALIQIQSMKTKIQLYKTSIKDYDKHIFEAKFYSRYVSMKPFFIWKHETHSEMFKKLLSGQSVAIKADILQSAVDKDAIKFNFIEINFKSTNLSIQSEIDREVLKFGVQMKHLGNSHYRYNNKFYVLHSESQSIEYSFEKNADGKAVTKNHVYQKLLSGNIMLSPYAMWEIKLTPTSKAVSFNALKTFHSKVDLALEGRGRYVQAGSTQYALDEYYQVDESISVHDQNGEVSAHNSSDESEKVEKIKARRVRRNISKKINFSHTSCSEKLFTGSEDRVDCPNFGFLEDDFTNLDTKVLSSNPGIGNDSKNVRLMSSDNSLVGSLTLSQWLAGLFFKKNKTLDSRQYLNEENKRLTQLYEREKEILPWLRFDRKLFNRSFDFDDLFYSKVSDKK